MILTKVTMDTGCCLKYKITDPYSIHRMVYSFFPEKSPERFLYADQGLSGNRREILILSGSVPELPEDVPGCSRKIGDQFFSHSSFRFEILLNPVKTTPRSNKREPVKGQLPLLTYFTDRMKKWGFECDLETLEVVILPSMNFTKKGHSCRMHKVKYRGVLTVTDQDTFRKCFESGIGHGKAFGFGLLQLIPIK